MSLSTYSELQDAIGDWLNRGDLDTQIVDFISLAELRMGRELRKVVIVAPLDIAAGVTQVQLPEDCAELRSIRHDGAVRNGHVHITTPWGLDTYRDIAAGTPCAAAIVNNSLLLNRETDAAYTMEIVYFASITPLSDTDPQNVELEFAPDLYLFGALSEAAPFLEHDSRVGLWEAKYQAALSAVNAARESAEFGAGPTEMSLPVVFG